MSVKLTTVKKVNPQDVEAPQKFYARAVGTGKTDLKRLSKMISMQCTVSRADCLAVLAALEDNIILELQDGRIVELGDIGTFQMGVRSEGKDTPEEIGANSVKKTRLYFRPGEELRKMMQNVTFYKSNNTN